MVNWDREAALNIAVSAAKLLDEKYFNDVCDALLAEDETKFIKLCNKAGVAKENEPLQHQLYSMFRGGIATNTDMIWP